MLLGLSLQFLLDLFVACISLAIGLSFFAFVTIILCFAAFLNNVKDGSS